ncbi:hypothetical protein ACOI1H_23730 [Loktanella sp. DJP18]|uniref:hypothetical protein n=1 Tax=Loktanella sp. DJP18 TaxID=3409788 RepID=UPI003BB6D43F
MKRSNSNLRNTAIAAIIGLPFTSGIAFAQDTQQSAGQTDAPSAQSGDATQQQSASSTAQNGSAEQSDVIVATVGGSDIMSSDVLTVIDMLPPQLRTQPPEMLVPMAMEQLILRQLILAEARAQNLAEDPEVIALVEGATQAAEDDAIVQVWMGREMANAVTDEAVQQEYDRASGQTEQELPPLADVRPQIEQHLRQQALQAIQTNLRAGANIVFFDATGNPVEQPQDQNNSGGSGDSAQDNEQSAGQTDEQSAGQTDAPSAQSSDAMQQPSASSTTQSGSAEQPDVVVATVGGSVIMSSDVLTVIDMLPPQLKTQLPEMLVPMAMEQLILRQLILAEAQAQNLAEDPEVIALTEGATQAAEDDAIVQVWMGREMANAVTDETVQQEYDRASGQTDQELPPLADVRPQIEQHLRQQALQAIRTNLRAGADIVFFDATGNPVEQSQDQSTSGGSGDSVPTTSGNDAASDSDASGNAESGNAEEDAPDSSNN